MHDTSNPSRREFCKLSAAALAGAALTPSLPAANAPGPAATAIPWPQPDRLIWANLVHLSNNMWLAVSDTLRFDDSLWRDITEKMSKAGMNMLVIDLGDGIRYESHPEIAVKGAWSSARLREELARLHTLGLEPIPKLNFSTTHDAWLHEYSRMVSTPAYYKVCAELIAEAATLFGKPRFFHLGYDEETAQHQSQYSIVIVRQHELWWHDFDFFVRTVEALGVGPWIWSDFAWAHPEDFYAKMPRQVLQSNWYYELAFDKTDTPVIKTFHELDKHGYDQIPTGSNWSSPENFGKLVEWCRKEIPGPHLKGFLQTPWRPTLEAFRANHLHAVDQVAEAIRKTLLEK